MLSWQSKCCWTWLISTFFSWSWSELGQLLGYQHQFVQLCRETLCNVAAFLLVVLVLQTKEHAWLLQGRVWSLLILLGLQCLFSQVHSLQGMTGNEVTYLLLVNSIHVLMKVRRTKLTKRLFFLADFFSFTCSTVFLLLFQFVRGIYFCCALSS